MTNNLIQPSHREQQDTPVNFYDILVNRAVQQPDAVAYLFHRTDTTTMDSLTYAELLLRVDELVAALIPLVTKGDRVLISMPSCPEFVVSFLSCQALNVIAVPVPQPTRNRVDTRLEHILTDAEPELLLTTKAIAETFGQATGAGLLDLPRLAVDDLTSRSDSRTDFTSGRDETTIAFLQYTSGSTGEPKGVSVSNGNLMHNSQLMEVAFLPKRRNIGVTWLPLFHDMGLIGGILQPLYAGFPAIIVKPATFLMQPGLWLQLISDYRVTISVAPNFALDLCVQKHKAILQNKLNLSSLEVLLCGAEPVQADTLNSFAEVFADTGFQSSAFCPVYGLAEATLFVSGQANTQPFDSKHYPRDLIGQIGAKVNVGLSPDTSTSQSIALVACGPTAQEVQIVNPESGEPLNEGQVGEIWIAGESVCEGYWQRPEQTEQAFGNHLTPVPGQPEGQTRYLRTGDLGFEDNGQLFVTGRIKDLIIVRGRNIYPQDIERAASSSSSALAQGLAAAFVTTIDSTDQVVVLAEVTRQGLRALKEPSAAEQTMQSIARNVLVETGVTVARISLLRPNGLYRTSSGKVRRSANKEGFENQSFKSVAEWQFSGTTEEFDDPGAPLLTTREEFEQWIVTRLANRCALSSHEIALDQPFVNFGLDSLAAVEMITALEKRSGASVPLDPTLLWDYPTVSSLIDYLCTDPADNPDTLQADESDQQTVDAAEEIRQLRELLET